MAAAAPATELTVGSTVETPYGTEASVVTKKVADPVAVEGTMMIEPPGTLIDPLPALMVVTAPLVDVICAPAGTCTESFAFSG